VIVPTRRISSSRTSGLLRYLMLAYELVSASAAICSETLSANELLKGAKGRTGHTAVLPFYRARGHALDEVFLYQRKEDDDGNRRDRAERHDDAPVDMR